MVDLPLSLEAGSEKRSKEMSEQKTVSVALGSGGARGLAHIGVFQVLDEEGF